MLVVLVTGMPGAGKEGIVNRALEHGFSAYRMGDVVREFAEKNQVSAQSIGEYASREREAHGSDIWAKRVLEKIMAGASDRIVIDGCRSQSEVSVFRKHFGASMSVVAVHSSPQTRFKRLITRGRDDAPENRQEFDRRDIRELDWGVGRVIALADHMIVNEGTIEEFWMEIDTILEKLLSP